MSAFNDLEFSRNMVLGDLYDFADAYFYVKIENYKDTPLNPDDRYRLVCHDIGPPRMWNQCHTYIIQDVYNNKFHLFRHDKGLTENQPDEELEYVGECTYEEQEIVVKKSLFSLIKNDLASAPPRPARRGA